MKEIKLKGLEQSVSNLKIENEILSFEHEIQKNSNIDFNKKTTGETS